ncbi:TldD/PmbA family protein [Fusibacter bizertensis]|uniref:TldD/PmbA family protein n=1 Tax=Fusibacter bizertensis TaxID=1488331 RepID=A0ABT6NGZ4_9FIRM|nr:TldD/PmbA family protein [Fusibacter bizertensis]MDH8679647.1 TldD/PmbA family protein [Fusibacter bizertensis]
MNEQFIEALFAKGSTKGFDAQEIYYVNNKNTEISVYQGQIDKFNVSEDGGLSYRGMVDGKLGYSYTEIMDESSIEMLVNEAYANAKVIEIEDEVFLHDGSGEYAEVDNFNPELERVSIEKKIQFMLDLEQSILTDDPRVKTMSQNSYDEVESIRRIKNTNGLDVTDQVNYCLAYAVAIVEENEDKRTGLGYDISNSFSDLSIEKITREATGEALKMLGAKSIKSVKCPVVIKNETFAQLFSAYMGILNAERVQKNLSKLGDKLGEVIASSELTLYDDPHLKGALSSSSFDAEGVATMKKPVIEDGVLKTFFHNLKTASKAGVVSTGNASKGSYKGTVGIAPSNLVIKPGEKSLEEVVSTIDTGVYILELQGLHAGINTISGDFSLQCYGYMIENGALTKPVSQITVAGNFFEMLMDIECFANDFRFSILSSDYTGAASVKIKQLSISGE